MESKAVALIDQLKLSDDPKIQKLVTSNPGGN